jgi:ferredoxin
MKMQVNQELCAGCGTCMDECPEGAIQLVDQKAVIDVENGCLYLPWRW